MWNSAAAALTAGVAITAAVTPFDVAATRLYNQPTHASTNRGLLYRGIADCSVKIVGAEDVYGLYKGTTAVYVRQAPHTLINLVVWTSTAAGTSSCAAIPLAKQSNT